ncbi:MAG: DUF4139 domain-containing protein [Rhodospirillaceae bacterium]|nr:DUF4139 domain-containing protein [Rhodospirillaceae bacterium]
MHDLRTRALAALCFTALPFCAVGQEVDIPVTARKGLDLTIYESDLALIKDRRALRPPRAEATFAFSGVSAHMRPETALLSVLDGAPWEIVEQTFDFNVASPQTLLERSVGQEVTILTMNPATGRETSERAKVLSIEDEPLFEIAGKIHSQIPGRVVFDKIPAGLRPTPALLVTAKADPSREALMELSYLSGGLSWRADYVAEFDSESNRLDLAAWATVTNTTGVDFKDAKVKLVSGALNRIAPQPMMKAARGDSLTAMAAAAPAPGVQRQELGGYHLYDVARPVSLGNNQTKQLALLDGSGLKAKKEYLVRGEVYFYNSQVPGRTTPAQAEQAITFKNDADAGFGLPLPAGSLRVYGQDASGASQFLGEDALVHTPQGGEVRIDIGRDFDVTFEREQTSFVRASDRITLVAWKVTLKNAKTKPVGVRVIEPLAGSWEITRESHSRVASNANMAEWLLDVPAKGQTVLEYTAKIEY